MPLPDSPNQEKFSPAKLPIPHPNKKWPEDYSSGQRKFHVGSFTSQSDPSVGTALNSKAAIAHQDQITWLGLWTTGQDIDEWLDIQESDSSVAITICFELETIR